MPPQCQETDVAAVLERMPAVEIYGVMPSFGQHRSDYPFKTLLHESSSYKHMKKVHFEALVPSTMEQACHVGAGGSPALQVMLWSFLFVA